MEVLQETEQDGSESQQVVHGLVEAARMVGRTSELRYAAMAAYAERSSSALAYLRQSSFEWAVLTRTLVASGAFKRVARILRPAAKKIRRLSPEEAFVITTGPRPVIHEHRLYQAVMLVLQTTRDAVQAADGGTQAWLRDVLDAHRAVKKGVAHVRDVTPTRVRSLMVYSSLFFLRILCPMFVRPGDYGLLRPHEQEDAAVGPHLLWVCKTVMRLVAAVMVAEPPGNPDAEAAMASIREIVELLKQKARNLRKSAPPQPRAESPAGDLRLLAPLFDYARTAQAQAWPKVLDTEAAEDWALAMELASASTVLPALHHHSTPPHFGEKEEESDSVVDGLVGAALSAPKVSSLHFSHDASSSSSVSSTGGDDLAAVLPARRSSAVQLDSLLRSSTIGLPSPTPGEGSAPAFSPGGSPLLLGSVGHNKVVLKVECGSLRKLVPLNRQALHYDLLESAARRAFQLSQNAPLRFLGCANVVDEDEGAGPLEYLLISDDALRQFVEFEEPRSNGLLLRVRLDLS